MTRTRRNGLVARESGSEVSSRHHAVGQNVDSAPVRQTFTAQPTLFDVPVDEDVLAGRDQAERNADDWWLHTALQAVRAIAKTDQKFQAFDLVETYGVPEPDHPNRWGALLTRAARNGWIVAVGAAPSRRPTTARSLTKTWRGAP